MSWLVSPSKGAREEDDWTFTVCQLSYSHKQAVIITTIPKTVRKKQNAPSPHHPPVLQMCSQYGTQKKYS